MTLRIVKHIASIAFVLMLTGCGYYSNGEFGPQDQRDFAKHFVALFAARDTAAIDKLLTPETRPEMASVLGKMIAVYPPEKPTSIQYYAYTVRSDTRSGTVYFLSGLYRFPGDKDLAVEVALKRTGASYLVAGVHFQTLPHAWIAANDFVLEGKPLASYAFLAAMAAVLATSLIALVQCIRTRGIRRKWLWVVFILFGFGKLSLNWATGAFVLTPVAIQILSASAFRSAWIGPWVLSISLPLGAILFLARRKRLVASPVVSSSPVPSEDLRSRE
jgi:hypothetical protein